MKTFFKKIKMVVLISDNVQYTDFT